MDEYIIHAADIHMVSNPSNLEQLDLQIDSELLRQAADNHVEHVLGSVFPTNSRGVVMTGRVTEFNKSGKEIAENSTNKRVIYIVAGDDGSHVPTLRQVELHRETDIKNNEKTMLTAVNLIEHAQGLVSKQAVRRRRLHLTSDSYQERSTNGIDEDTSVLVDKMEKSINSVDHSLEYAQEQTQLLDIIESNEMSSNGASDESYSDSSSGSESDKEVEIYISPNVEELNIARPPEVGMRFPTLEDAHEFYNTYALQIGFVAIRGRNYKRQKYQLDCNRSGKRKLTENLKRKRKRNTINKTQCQAKVVVKFIKGQWEFTAVQTEHNHSLSPSPSLTRFFLNQKLMSNEERSLLRVLQQSRVPPRKTMKILRRMRGSFRKISVKNKDGTTLQYAEQPGKANSDVEKILNHFDELQLRDPCFFYTTQTDENSVIRSLFWTDARSRMYYDIFGDLVAFDTTYSTHLHNMPFVPITGINNHGRTIVLGCALLQDHKAETFKWMFRTLLAVMGGKMPGAIITKQDEAMAKATAEVMPQVSHRFCKWDVMGKAREKIAVFMSARGNINVELDSLVNNSLTETEFEEGWAALNESYNASENKCLQLMWQTRKNWVPVYFREDFYPFVESTGCSKEMNLLFKDYVHPKDRIEKFIEKYEEMQHNIIITDDEDGLQSGNVPSYISLQPIEKHASHIYTRQIFLKVQRELLHSTAFNVQEIQRGTLYRLDRVLNYENPEFDRNSFEVFVEPDTNAFKCQCAKFSRDGILCCHIFRLFTQLGINEIPVQYIMPRWTTKFKEDMLKPHKEKCLDRHGMKHSQNTMRYAMLMKKVSDIGKEICGDGAKCDIFMLELDKIQEKMAVDNQKIGLQQLHSCGL